MKYTKRYVRIIAARYAALREKEERDRQLRCDVARRNPEFLKAEKLFSETSLDFAVAKAKGDDCKKEETAYLEAKKAYDSVCEKNGYDLTLHVRCKICNDTGFVGERLCKCATPLYYSLVKEDSGIKRIPDFTFDDNRAGEVDCAQSRQLCVLYDKMKEFCDRFLEQEHVAVIPGSAFGPGGEGFVRACYAASMKNLTEALTRLERFLGTL